MAVKTANETLRVFQTNKNNNQLKYYFHTKTRRGLVTIRSGEQIRKIMVTNASVYDHARWRLHVLYASHASESPHCEDATAHDEWRRLIQCRRQSVESHQCLTTMKLASFKYNCLRPTIHKVKKVT